MTSLIMDRKTFHTSVLRTRLPIFITTIVLIEASKQTQKIHVEHLYILQRIYDWTALFINVIIAVLP